MQEYYIAWWNLENLFDVEDSTDRPPYLKERLKKELKGWNANVLDLKLDQLAKIILKMNKNEGPDILGVCEVENKKVMVKLLNKLNIPNRNYNVVHHDCKDLRGIDVAFIYDNNKFETKEQFCYNVLKRAATRDLYQVNFKSIPKNNDLIIIGNHWPSRSGGVYMSEPYRILAAETLAYWNERIKQIKEKDASVIVMGDFNDEPFDRSMHEFALSSRSKQKVLRSKTTPRLYNLMWPLMEQELGTYYFRNFPHMLDQFLISRNFLKSNRPFSIKDESVEIIQYPELYHGTYKVPRHFGRPNKDIDTKGYSDHFPIGMIVEEK
ncbi:MAG: endonuclease/exonuclease/phosphatase family protein [Promethearchaeota archaeon]